MLDLFVNRSLYPAAPLQQRVALVTGSYDRTVDGVALTLNRLVGHLVQSGHEVLVLCPAASSSRPALVRHAGAPVQRVPSVPFPVWWEYRLTWGLGGAATRALAAFAPTVVHVAVQDAMGHAAQRWAARRRVPVVCSYHTRWSAYLPFYNSWARGWAPVTKMLWWGLRRFHSNCAATLPPSRSVADELVSHGVPRVHVWPRGVDRALFRPGARSDAWRASVGAPGADDVVVLLVARLRWEKGLAAFADALRRLDAAGVAHTAVVVGSGPARSRLHAALPNATFTGTLTGEALAAAYASADVFLFPSTTEGWGGTCLEAQASGLPVVATASSGIVEVVDDGVGGLLVAPGDTAALAAAVGRLARDGEYRRAMGARAAAHAARFDWSASGELMLAQYAAHATPVPPHDGDDTRPPPPTRNRTSAG